MDRHETELINEATRPEIGYEYRDIGDPKTARKIVNVTVIFFVFTALMAVITIPMYWIAVTGGFDTSKWGMPAYKVDRSRVPQAPNPMLQTDVQAKTDIRDLRMKEEAAVTTYQWKDKAGGTVSIPVDEAMTRVAERGLQGGSTN